METSTILTLARRFIHTATGDEEDHAWQSIARSVNEKAQPEKLAWGRIFGARRAKKKYEKLGKNDHPEIVHMMTAGADDVIVKEKRQQHGL